METKFKMAVYATIIAFCLVTQSATAQWQTLTSGFDTWTQVNPVSNAQSVGIGDFNGNSVVPLSALHINTNSAFLPASSTFNAGEVFRTDAPSGLTAWRMFSANVAANEKFSIINPNASNNVEISATRPGDMIFNSLGLSPNNLSSVPSGSLLALPMRSEEPVGSNSLIWR